MDPITCCLLQICCNLATRQKKVVAHFKEFGVTDEVAEQLANDAILRADTLLAMGFGEILKHAAEHAKKDKD